MTRRGLIASLVGIGLLAGACSHPAAIRDHVHHPTPVTAPPLPPPNQVATAAVPTVPVFDAPGGLTPALNFANPSILEPSNRNSPKEPLVFLVRAAQPGWLQVSLPHRPNGSTGWIRASDVTLTDDALSMVISLGAHHMTVLSRGTPVDQATVAIGRPGSPTPTGSFYVTESIPCGTASSAACYLSGPFGSGAFGVSGYSNVYNSFDGGNGQIAIHGTNQPSLIGQSISHGCVRVANADMARLMKEIPVGTPVDITA